ncbi:hypothetical protein MKEN_00179000 [Mycena kentingensis (nom. inval.)]|nr:hypothetical protein MKEN_00179000 [Mycena kentingensis (nom. inval.)]
MKTAIVVVLDLCALVAAQASSLYSYSIPAQGASPVWDLPLPPVLMDVHNTNNYGLNGTVADAQWASLLPSNDGILQFGDRQFMLSMVHQLRCLDIIRRDYVAGWQGTRRTPNGETSEQTLHCLNYIRQMVLCRGDRRLECVVDPFGEHAVQVRGAQKCLDWTKVFEGMGELATH